MTAPTDRELMLAAGWPPEEVDRQVRINAEMNRLLKAGVDPITAVVMAGDRIGAEYWAEEARSGRMDPKVAINLIGSYARLDLALRFSEEGLVAREWLYTRLPDLWRGSDPDDTDPRFLTLWRDAWEYNLFRVIRDGPKLPGRTRRLTVYRGQRPGDPPGIAWTLDPDVAGKFARTLGGRGIATGGAVLRGQVGRADVMGYLTQRGESEVVADPADIHDIEEVQR